MGRRKPVKQVHFYEHSQAEKSTTRRYHANTAQPKRSLQLEVHAVTPASNLPADNEALVTLEPAVDPPVMQDDFPPEVIVHNLAGITVVARSSEGARKKYETTVSLSSSIFETIISSYFRSRRCFPSNNIDKTILTKRFA